MKLRREGIIVEYGLLSRVHVEVRSKPDPKDKKQNDTSKGTGLL